MNSGETDRPVPGWRATWIEKPIADEVSVPDVSDERPKYLNA